MKEYEIHLDHKRRLPPCEHNTPSAEDLALLQGSWVKNTTELDHEGQVPVGGAWFLDVLVKRIPGFSWNWNLFGLKFKNSYLNLGLGLVIHWFCLQNQRPFTSVSDMSDGVGEPPLGMTVTRDPNWGHSIWDAQPGAGFMGKPWSKWEHSPWKWMVGRLLYFFFGGGGRHVFRGKLLVLGRVGVLLGVLKL